MVEVLAVGILLRLHVLLVTPRITGSHFHREFSERTEHRPNERRKYPKKKKKKKIALNHEAKKEKDPNVRHARITRQNVPRM